MEERERAGGRGRENETDRLNDFTDSVMLWRGSNRIFEDLRSGMLKPSVLKGAARPGKELPFLHNSR